MEQKLKNQETCGNRLSPDKQTLNMWQKKQTREKSLT